MRRILISSALVAIFLAGCTSQVVRVEPPAPAVTPTPAASPQVSPSPVVPSPRPTPTVVPTPKPTPTVRPSPVPTGAIDWPVPFTPQAPYAVWDDLHNEACEEASMLMADAYIRRKPLNAHLMEQGILNLVKWQNQNGYTVDVTAAETVKILSDYFQLSSRLITNPTVADIRAELEAGRIIIVPAAGRRLGNPNFRQPGPLYHMLVIRGYDPARDEFITNDPGTRKGEKYRYKTSVFLAANHDWPKPGKTKDDVTDAEMEAGAKVMIVVGE